MTLEVYFQLIVSIAATLLSVLLLVIVIFSGWLLLQIRTFVRKIDLLVDTTSEMTNSIKGFVVTTTERLTAMERMFLTVQGIQQVASQVAEVFHRRKSTGKSASLINKE
jgi:uncharacterized protein YoxC